MVFSFVADTTRFLAAWLVRPSMVRLPTFLLVLALLIFRECSSPRPILNLTSAAWFSLATILALGLAARFGRRWQRSRSLAGGSLSGRSPSRPDSIDWLWIVAQPVLLLATGWIGWSKALAQLDWPETCSYAFLFVPSLLLVVTLELTLVPHEVRPTSDGWQGRWSPWLASRCRVDGLVGLATCLLPVMLIAMGVDGLQLLAPESEVVRVLAAALAVALALALFPVAFSTWFGLRTLRGSSLGGRIEHYRRQAGVLRIESFLGRSEDRLEGAAIVGWLPWTRRLWLSDRLVDRLNRQELDMIILHELAHLQRHHFFWRITPLLWTVGIGLIYVVAAQQLPEGSWQAWLGRALTLGLSAVVLAVGLGHVARSCELEADALACQLARRYCPWAAAPGRAENVLTATLTKLIGGSALTAGQSWLHPSLRQRVTHLAKGLAQR